ncbi:hypothetical protein B0H14DRAFT_2581993 [Mycena olivaceomarginata]|nr:hypothetical protein B0H14DRAFT_2581993 [Mycena olivaceomarginata]
MRSARVNWVDMVTAKRYADEKARTISKQRVLQPTTLGQLGDDRISDQLSHQFDLKSVRGSGSGVESLACVGIDENRVNVSDFLSCVGITEAAPSTRPVEQTSSSSSSETMPSTPAAHSTTLAPTVATTAATSISLGSSVSGTAAPTGQGPSLRPRRN